MKIPFGKYKGLDTSSVHSSYLTWLLSVSRTGALRKAIEEEMTLRNGKGWNPRENRE